MGATARRRTIKVRGGHLGPILCWAVVFADIGTSVYYVPGILYGQYGTRSALFVTMTMAVFVLLSIKYAEVAWRYPEGGGVVTVASRALHPFVGLLGGLFILVDYYLTAALSALSGVFYLAVVAPQLIPVAVPLTIGSLLFLGLLNAFGIKESAGVSAVFATAAAAGQLIVVVAVAIHLGPSGIAESFRQLGHGASLTPITLVTGYSAAFLAFSGLESIAQIAPAMKEVRRVVAYRAMGLVIITIAATSPLLTLWSTTLLDGTNADPNQFISLLGTHVAGWMLGDFVAISGSLLLVFASNTAIIGAYHVFVALTRMGFLPRVLEKRNRLRGTPHWAILAAVVLPMVIVAVTSGNVNLLGDLYAFGLLGAFVLTCLALDVVRHRETVGKRNLVQQAGYALGVLTTLLVLVAWSVNLVAKPLATAFGGGLTLLGLLVGYLTYRRKQKRRPVVFPVPYQPDQAAASIAEALRGRPAEVMAILPRDTERAAAIISDAMSAAPGGRIVFLYQGERRPPGAAEFREVAAPYLKDYSAQDAFSRAESMSRKSTPDRRYVYVPGNLRREIVGEIWKEIGPRETIVTDDDYDLLPPIALDRVRRHVTDGGIVLHLFTSRARKFGTTAASIVTP